MHTVMPHLWLFRKIQLRGTGLCPPFCFLLVVLLFLPALAQSTSQSGSDSRVIPLKQAGFIISDSAHPPPDVAAWTPVRLIDRWGLQRYQKGDNGWYRITIPDAVQVDQTMGIYLPRFNMNVAVYLNGEFIAGSGRFEHPLSRNWNRPFLVQAPAVLWRQQGNVLHVRLKSYLGHGYLSPVYIGPYGLLKQEYDTRHLLQIDISSVLLPVTLLIGLFVLALWFKRRHDSQYLWFSLAVLTWTLFSANMVVVDLPISTFAWEVIAYASLEWFAVFLTIFGLRFAGYAFHWRELLFFLFALLATISYLNTDIISIKHTARFWHAGSILLGVFAVFFMLRKWKQQGRTGVPMMAFAVAVILAAAVHDWMFQFNYISPTGSTGFHLLHYSAPVIFIMMAWHLIRRFISALNESEMLNRELEQRIRSKETELEQHYQTIQSMQKHEAVVEERERLSREIHDGMGGNLANAIMMSQLIQRDMDKNRVHDVPSRLDNLTSLLDNSLSEMRNLILTMEDDITSLGSLISHINDKCARILDDAGIGFVFKTDVADEEIRLTQEQSLNILRILQEASNNIIKHARAAEVVLEIFEDSALLTLKIKDNGYGFNVDDKASGYGLRNIKKRAAEIGAKLAISSHPDEGTQISLQLQL